MVYLDSNTDTKSHGAQCEVVVERSTEDVRTWKEKLATESEADVKADRGETEADAHTKPSHSAAPPTGRSQAV
ncbi:hypothetical protein V500_09739 [Pseudogymnoascus sp. VKM F-4518 (FW-2643)]|nr:hypothetical protein V500_09739 [Pseudogymnoascus sp. VKM F-4518 (FW-2643)]